MSPQQQGFDFLPLLAGAQFSVSPAMLDVDRRVEIGMRAVATDHTAKRLLVGPVRTVYIMPDTALLRGIGASDPDGGDSPVGGIPGESCGDGALAGGGDNVFDA